MKYIKTIFIQTLIISFCLFILSSCEEKNEKNNKKKDKEEQITISDSGQTAKNSSTTIDCDTTFWRYVYNPERLEIINKCKTVTGVIEESNPDEDGDQHMLLKLDKGQEDLLTKRNTKKKEGDLVIEAVCANNPSL